MQAIQNNQFNQGLRLLLALDAPSRCALFQGAPAGDSEQPTIPRKCTYFPTSHQDRLEQSAATTASKLTPECGVSTTIATMTVVSFCQKTRPWQQGLELHNDVSKVDHNQGNNSTTPSHQGGGNPAMTAIMPISAPVTYYHKLCSNCKVRCSQQPPRLCLRTVAPNVRTADDNGQTSPNIPAQHSNTIINLTAPPLMSLCCELSGNGPSVRNALGANTMRMITCGVTSPPRHAKIMVRIAPTASDTQVHDTTLTVAAKQTSLLLRCVLCHSRCR